MKILPAIALPQTAKPGGLHFSYFEGNWKNFPNLRGLTPTQSGLAGPGFGVGHFLAKSSFVCTLDGYLQTPENGYYTFFLEADEFAKLYIGDSLLMTVDNSLDKQTSTSFLVPLMKGPHAIRIEYFHTAGDKNLKLTYLTPMANGAPLAHLPIEIPPELFFGSDQPEAKH